MLFSKYVQHNLFENSKQINNFGHFYLFKTDVLISLLTRVLILIKIIAQFFTFLMRLEVSDLFKSILRFILNRVEVVELWNLNLNSLYLPPHLPCFRRILLCHLKYKRGVWNFEYFVGRDGRGYFTENRGPIISL